MITNMANGRKVGPPQPQSPSYTLAELKELALEYIDYWERDTNSTQVEFRLMVSLMIEWLAKREKEVGDERGTTV